jgi:GNAT superfamily N-acetyltransferase
MHSIHIRTAGRTDVQVLASLLDEYAVGHPAERHPRPLARLEEAFFGDQPLGRFLLAETRDEVVGFAGWTRIYEVYWAIYGGQPIGLYVKPAFRGTGVAAMLLASVCAGIRAEGGQFLWAAYDDRLAPLYERVAVGDASRSCHLSGAAFRRVADLAGASARDILRGLPDKSLNFEA